MLRRRTSFLRVLCAGIVIACVCFALQRRRGVGFHHTRMQSKSKQTQKLSTPQRVYEAIHRDGKNRDVNDFTKMCEIPRRLSTYLEDLVRKRMLKRSVNTKSVDENATLENHIKEFSFHKRFEHYPFNGTGASVDNLSDYFDPALFNSFCNTPVNLTAIVPVYSAADRFTHRHLLRNSLGRLATSLNCKMFFIVGFSSDANVNELLQEEYAVERDILMIDKIDTYRDLNNKAYAMLRWINKFCKQVPYVVHLVDDTYINLRSILQRLHGIKNKFYMYARQANLRTIRTSWPKSSVTVEEYIYDRFPPYAFGMVYAFPTIVAERLLSVVHSATYCWIEDVWIGGHVRIAAKVKLIDFGRRNLCTGHWKHVSKHKSPPQCFGMHPVDVELLCGWYNGDINH